jgi:hypothetical protein
MLSLNVTALDAGPQLLAVAAGGRIAACNGCGVEVMTATGKRYAAGDRLYEEPTPLYITRRSSPKTWGRMRQPSRTRRTAGNDDALGCAVAEI